MARDEEYTYIELLVENNVMISISPFEKDMVPYRLTPAFAGKRLDGGDYVFFREWGAEGRLLTEFISDIRTGLIRLVAKSGGE